MPVQRLKVRPVTAAAVGGAAACAAVAVAQSPFSTTPKAADGSGGQAELFKLATACHADFDRIVVRARQATPGYKVRYVQRIVADGSGDVVPLLGSKRLRVVVPEARGHTEAGDNLLARVRTPRCPNLRQVKVAGDFEGIVTLGLGLKRKTGFRVLRLSNPTRLVVDVRHHAVAR